LILNRNLFLLATALILAMCVYLLIPKDLSEENAMRFAKSCGNSESCFVVSEIGVKSMLSGHTVNTKLSCKGEGFQLEMQKRTKYDGGQFYFLSCNQGEKEISKITVWHAKGGGINAFVKDCSAAQCQKWHMPI